jgi:hypothetical protein
MPKRKPDDPGTRSNPRRNEKPSRPAGGEMPERSGTRDGGRSWVHDEPQLEQGDEPQRSGYSDRETPEAPHPGTRTGEPAEPRPKR